MENKFENQLERAGIRWSRLAGVVKFVTIGFLMLMLLIPSAIVQNLIGERTNRQAEVHKEIAEKWSAAQIVEGPVIILPYKKFLANKDENGRVSYLEEIQHIYLLPETLNFSAGTDVRTLHRSIFDATVYSSKIKVEGSFGALEMKKSGIDPASLMWQKARIVIGVSDLKGLKNYPKIRLAGNSYEVEADFSSEKLFSNNLYIQPDLSRLKSTALHFRYELDLNGSDELLFRHLAKLTTVNVSGAWTSPSFSGKYLPDERQVSDKGFSASWKMSYFDRPYAQQSVDEKPDFKGTTQQAVCGVKFKPAVDQYQMTMRSAKYSVLIVLLSFLALYFTEMISRRAILLQNYLLIGCALVVYYCLLLALSEQLGFNLAYMAASMVTIGLISAFQYVSMKSSRLSGILAAILTFYYAFIFLIIQLEDIALMVGSISLFVTVAVLMYLSVKLQTDRSPSDERDNPIA